MKSLLEWWDEENYKEEQQPEDSEESQDSEEKNPSLEDKKIIKGLKASTVSNLITFTIQQGINKPDGDFDALKKKLIGYIDMLKTLIEEM